MPAGLFPHQSDLARWAVRRGRAAIFADTGLGKSRMQLAWADIVRRESGCRVLILAPLAVAPQTVAEGAEIGIDVVHAKDGADTDAGIIITNYDRLHRFDASAFGAVVLDESSIIKHHDAKTLKTLLEAFRETSFKLCATATPAPNDWTELGTHAEFLGVCSRSEMLAEFFVHDGGDTQTWRIKGHAKHAFWQWVASWGALIRSPADLGHDASAYRLPPVDLREHIIRSDYILPGSLFVTEAQSLMERREARRDSIADRVRECAAVVNADRESWVIWCDLNAEGDALRAAIPDAVEVRGADDLDVKEQRLRDFASGKIRVLVTKPSIAGFGLNWQHCARMSFVGVTDSFESYYQAVRRCWRFGQTRTVCVHIFASEREGAVVANLKRKEADALAMSEMLSGETRAAVQANVLGMVRQTNPYNATRRVTVPRFLEVA
jgi:hypothetical protein